MLQGYRRHSRAVPHHWKQLLLNLSPVVMTLTTTKAATATSDLPSTMKGPPISSLVPPGQCQFGPDPQPVTLMQRFPVSPTSAVLRFALPDPTKPLNLCTCACLLAHANVDGEAVTRPYTPISTNHNVGFFDLLVKNYGPAAKMSRKMHEILPGDADSIAFSHIPPNVKIQAEDFVEAGRYDHVGMLVGGTGITPMIQALHAILGAGKSKTTSGKAPPKVTMLYGSKTSDDILGKELLHQWAKDYPDQFTLVDVLSHEPVESEWNDGKRGFIDQKLVEAHFPPSAAVTDDEDTGETTNVVRQLIFVCGPPPMYNALCGPREEREKVSGVLAELGYTPQQVYKF